MVKIQQNRKENNVFMQCETVQTSVDHEVCKELTPKMCALQAGIGLHNFAAVCVGEGASC
jgi:hypothetical protein